jgi:hypothetical protein
VGINDDNDGDNNNSDYGDNDGDNENNNYGDNDNNHMM